jgi:hypothetical protein
MGIPPHIIIIGMPIDIILFIMSQRAVIISIEAASIGIILQTMPSFCISQVIFAIIGIIIGMGMPFIIMPFIIGMLFIIEPIIDMGDMGDMGIIEPIIGMDIIGIEPFIIDGIMWFIMPFIMFGIIIGIALFIIGIAFITAIPRPVGFAIT